MAIPPYGGKGFADLEPPGTRMAGTVMFTHAATLADMTLGIPAGRCARLLLAERLDDVERSIAIDRTANEIVEPGFWDLPVAPIVVPGRGRRPPLLDERSVPRGKW